MNAEITSKEETNRNNVNSEISLPKIVIFFDNYIVPLSLVNC